MGVKCFLLVPGDRIARYARSYDEQPCDLSGMRRHDIIVPVDTVPAAKNPDGTYDASPDLPATTPWPTHCVCGYEFPAPKRVTFTQLMWRRADTGEEMTLRDAPPGAVWVADWMPAQWSGPDGRCVVVKTPDGVDWMIDGRANNCTMPEDNEHRCWVRHGEPPNLTVDKNGKTCAAGAGSIQTSGYHGHLQNGEFT